jgi:hypothetical protein
VRAAEASERPPNVTASMERTCCTHRIAFYGNVQTKNAGRMIYGISCRRGYTCDVTMLVKGALRRGLKPAASPGRSRGPARAVSAPRRAGPLSSVERYTFYAYIFRKNMVNRAKVHAILDERFKESVYTTGVEYERCGVRHENSASCAAGWRAGGAVRGRRCSLLLINGLKLRAASALPLIPAVEGRRAGGQKARRVKQARRAASPCQPSQP